MRTHTVVMILVYLCTCAAQQIQFDTLSDSDTLKNKQEAITNPDMQNLPYLLKQQQSTLPTGTLHIIVHPKTARIFINSREVTPGTTLIKDLAPGNYSLYVTDGNNTEEQVVSVVSGVVRKVDIKLGRYVYFNATSSFSNIWAHGIRSFGPSLDIGLKIGKQYFGLNYHWDFLDAYFNEEDYNWDDLDSNSPSRRSRGETFGGAAFQWYYDVYEIPNILYVAPGFCSGFWWNWTSKSRLYFDSINGHWSYDEYFYGDDFLFGGPSVRISAGYKSAFVNCAYTLLLGTTVAHSLVVGARFMF